MVVGEHGMQTFELLVVVLLLLLLSLDVFLTSNLSNIYLNVTYRVSTCDCTCTYTCTPSLYNFKLAPPSSWIGKFSFIPEHGAT